jgi:hypothetical protein
LELSTFGARMLERREQLCLLASLDNEADNAVLWPWLQEAADARDDAVMALHALVFV